MLAQAAQSGGQPHGLHNLIGATAPGVARNMMAHS
jgi:hypothetical protein